MFNLGQEPGSAYDACPPYTIDADLIEAVEEAFRLAWKMIIRKPDSHASGSETLINSSMEQMLIDIHQRKLVPGFNEDNFETPEAGSGYRDYSGENVEKRPDLRFRMQSDIPLIFQHKKYRAYIIECKIVSDTNSVTASCDDGLQRFADGDYGWALCQGGMVVYVCPDAKFLDPLFALTGYFTMRWRGRSGQSLGEERVKRLQLTDGPRRIDGSDIVETVHHRNFTLRDENWNPTSVEAGPITVRHLWLRLS